MPPAKWRDESACYVNVCQSGEAIKCSVYGVVRQSVGTLDSLDIAESLWGSLRPKWILCWKFQEVVLEQVWIIVDIPVNAIACDVLLFKRCNQLLREWWGMRNYQGHQEIGWKGNIRICQESKGLVRVRKWKDHCSGNVRKRQYLGVHSCWNFYRWQAKVTKLELKVANPCQVLTTRLAVTAATYASWP